jgi:predicted nucleotidyltransferase
MNRSLKFFHSDKRAGGAGEDDEFAQAKEAWSQLNACRTYFQQLKNYQAQMVAAAEPRAL